MLYNGRGINDIGKGVTPENIVDNLYKIVKELKEHNIKPFIFSILYLSEKFDSWEKNNKSVKIVNEKIRNMCEKNSIQYIELNKVFSNNGKLRNEYCNDDGVHLNGMGYKKWSEKILPIIENEIYE
ncbi:MAG: hypothetical protein CR982_06975 [Candidatus Cloacimonadota bacterium]|nr:MAG: hypothetical protein CR982_06975 [Candidatus Cloacimonadota bacterium]PIE80659.1 MAG: hypothetical protein CSA15_01790 [Candidatus Delongbacteria bacterium]